MAARAKNPNAHIYHFASYEPTSLKRLMSTYATREQELDTLLREEAFVDLLKVVKRSLYASVEGYSIKNLEQFFGYEPVEVHGRNAGMLFTSEGYGELKSRLDQSGMVANLSLSAQNCNDRLFPVAVSASLIRDRTGQELATVMYVRDHTSVRAIEDALRDNNSRLNSLVQELGHVARHDQLTGLLNRGSAIQAAEAALVESADAVPFGVALFDLDHFKQVNDSYGHIVGDEVLSGVATVLNEAVCEGDIIGRFGGEATNEMLGQHDDVS